MVKELIHDPILLAQTSEPAGPQDRDTGRDLLDTLTYYRETCVGMAANMIGVCRRIICFDCGGTLLTLYNPQILKAWDSYDTEESLPVPFGRAPEVPPLAENQGPVRNRGREAPDPHLHGFPGPNHPA